MANIQKTLQLVLIALLSSLIRDVQGQETVYCYDGELAGTTLTTRNGREVRAFLGIPYAEKPIGPLRFRNPVPSEPWHGILPADKDGHQCPQLNEHRVVVGHEDCLTLNVYTPLILKMDRNIPLYPTIVYIHGGGFVSGNGSLTNYGPEFLLDENIVVVTMNYRLGVFGFLSTGDREAPGNFGLKDQALALKWVKQNIVFFGGDPELMTLCGQDAGAASVNLHALSELSRELFDRYIAQSGTAMSFWAFTEYSEYSKYTEKLGIYLQCPKGNSKILVDCLREMDVRRIVNTNDIFDDTFYIFKTWGPTDEPRLNGAFITELPVHKLLTKDSLRYRIIMGNVADEGLLFTAPLYKNDAMYEKIVNNIDDFLHYVTSIYWDENARKDLVMRVKNVYFNETVVTDKATFIKNLTNFISDVGFFMNSVHMTRLTIIDANSTVYMYSFDYRGRLSKTSPVIGSNENIGVTHGDDLFYLFPMRSELFGQPQRKLSNADGRMVETMVGLWTSFASTGIPNTKYFDEENFWLPYTYDNEEYLIIGENSNTSMSRGFDFNTYRSQFWDGLWVTLMFDAYSNAVTRYR